MAGSARGVLSLTSEGMPQIATGLRTNSHHERFDAAFNRSVTEAAHQLRFGRLGGARQAVRVACFDLTTQWRAVAVGERRDA